MKIYVCSYVLLVFKESNHIIRVHRAFSTFFLSKHDVSYGQEKLAGSVHITGRQFFFGLFFDRTTLGD